MAFSPDAPLLAPAFNIWAVAMALVPKCDQLDGFTKLRFQVPDQRRTDPPALAVNDTNAFQPLSSPVKQEKPRWNGWALRGTRSLRGYWHQNLKLCFQRPIFG